MTNIHPSSVISPQTEIAEGAEIGPFCIIKGRVKIGPGTRLESHVSIGSEHGVVELGRNNRISYGAALGGPPQDIHYKGEPTKLVIGDDNMIRECTTLNIGTVKGGGVTKVGNKNLIMAYVHLGHDVQMGDHNVIVNSTQVAGHVHIDHHATISGVCAFNQFVKIGSYSFTAGYSSVNKDILPYSVARGNYAVCTATNKIALERAGFSEVTIENIHKAVRILLKASATTSEGIERILQECVPSPEIDYLVKFVRESKRGLAK
jgi:UDP-N-acetylglucosamine acyltransferase